MSGHKIKYIGGDLELDPNFLFRKERGTFENYFLLNRAQDYALVGMGRDALKLAFNNEKMQPTDVVLMPSFLCMKIIDVIEDMGLQYQFYDVKEDLSVNREDLLNKVSAQTKAVLFINYFGYSPVNVELIDAVKTKNKNMVVILDCAQALFSVNEVLFQIKSLDYIVTSFRKFLSVPDGAFLVSNNKLINKKLIFPKPRSALYERILGKIIKNNYLSLQESQQAIETMCLEWIQHSEKMMDGEQNIHGLSSFSKAMLNKTHFEEIAEKRNQNALFLYEHLDRNLFLSHWNKKTTLLNVPIVIENRNAVRTKLMKYNIYLPVHWPLDSRINREQCRGAHHLSSKILGLVIDQRYNLEDMEYMVKILTTVLSDNS